MSIVAVCPGSFDPPTEGHINIIERGLKLFDKVIVAVAVNSSKKTMFTPEERVKLLKEIFKGRDAIEVDTFEDRLLVDYVRSKKAQVILRGLRTVQDYEYEFQMALANKQLASEIETVFIMTEAQYSHLSSSLIKEILYLGGKGTGMIPPFVEKKLKEKLKK
jgi:pantetheine-phosphate adenylyltransferase